MTENEREKPMVLPHGFVTDWALDDLEKRNAEAVKAGTLKGWQADAMAKSAEGAFHFLVAYMKENGYSFIGPSLSEVEEAVALRGDEVDDDD